MSISIAPIHNDYIMHDKWGAIHFLKMEENKNNHSIEQKTKN